MIINVIEKADRLVQKLDIKPTNVITNPGSVILEFENKNNKILTFEVFFDKIIINDNNTVESIPLKSKNYNYLNIVIHDHNTKS